MNPRNKQAAKAQADREIEQARIEAEEDLKAALATPSGRRFFFRILQDCGLDPLQPVSVFTGHSMSMSLRAGMRQIGENLAAAAKRVCLEQYQLAEREHIETMRNRRNARSQRERDADRESD